MLLPTFLLITFLMTNPSHQQQKLLNSSLLTNIVKPENCPKVADCYSCTLAAKCAWTENKC